MWILDFFGMKNIYFLIGIVYWVWVYLFRYIIKSLWFVFEFLGCVKVYD